MESEDEREGRNDPFWSMKFEVRSEFIDRDEQYILYILILQRPVFWFTFVIRFIILTTNKIPHQESSSSHHPIINVVKYYNWSYDERFRDSSFPVDCETIFNVQQSAESSSDEFKFVARVESNLWNNHHYFYQFLSIYFR